MTASPREEIEIMCDCGATVGTTLRRDFENCAEWVIDEHYSMDAAHSLPGCGVCSESGQRFNDRQIVRIIHLVTIPEAQSP